MNRIRELRVSKSWKQKELAAMLNTTQQAIGHYETGERGLDVETINKLCDIFGCTSDYLLCRSSSPFPTVPEDAAALIEAYERAPKEIRGIVDHALAPYQKSRTESSTA